MVNILRSNIFRLEEIKSLSNHPDLISFMNNRILVDNQSDNNIGARQKSNNLLCEILIWIEENCDGFVIAEETEEMQRCKSNPNYVGFSYVFYFQLDTDLSKFALRWQGNNE